MTLPKHFDLRHLEIFVAVADTRSMARAAAQFGITQAAVSQAVQRLERSVGMPLLDRASRPFHLTLAGTFVLKRARDIIAQTRILYQTLQGFDAGSAPELRLSIVDSFVGALMPDLLRALRQGVASDDIVLLSGLADRNLAALSNGDVDAVITADAEASDPGLPAIPLLRERCIAIAPPGSPGGGLARISGVGPLLGFQRTSALGRAIQLQLRRLRLPIEATMIFDRAEPLVSAVADGQGWAIATPLCLASSNVEPGRVAIHPIPEYKLRRQITFMTRSHEMSGLHVRVARIARDTAAAVLPDRLAAWAPWLPGEIEYLETRGTSEDPTVAGTAPE